MKELFIKIKILDRTYSLKVDDPKEEYILRKAGKELENRLNIKKDKLGVTDKQDLLSMIAFDSLVSALLQEESSNELLGNIVQLDQDVKRMLDQPN